MVQYFTCASTQTSVPRSLDRISQRKKVENHCFINESQINRLKSRDTSYLTDTLAATRSHSLPQIKKRSAQDIVDRIWNLEDFFCWAHLKNTLSTKCLVQKSVISKFWSQMFFLLFYFCPTPILHTKSFQVRKNISKRERERESEG